MLAFDGGGSLWGVLNAVPDHRRAVYCSGLLGIDESLTTELAAGLLG